jgi:hypothetical protein
MTTVLLTAATTRNTVTRQAIKTTQGNEFSNEQDALKYAI